MQGYEQMEELVKANSNIEDLRKRADQIEDMCNMFNSGYKPEAIACKYGLTKAGVQLILLKNKERIN